MPESLDLLYFSPTGTTKAVVHAIALGLGASSTTTLDVSAPDARLAVPQLKSDCLLIGAPVYFGRVQANAAQLFRGIRAPRERLPVVAVVVYGNRAWEDALLELCDIVTDTGYSVIAGAAFVGEHSFCDNEHPLAPGRPDASDLAIATAFGRAVRDKLDTGLPSMAIEVPGKRPYREPHAEPAPPPVTQAANCALCGNCASVCPTGAIGCTTRVETDAGLCIRCAACVKHCPTGARVLSNPAVDKVRSWLVRTCPQRREPELFL